MHWVVGDVHGCARELERLLREIGFTPGTDVLWSVGDLVNTGPDSVAAVRLWRDVGGRAVAGNHELYALAVRDGQTKRREDTLDDLLGSSEGEELLDALGRLPILVRLPETGGRESWLVHAGLRPDWHDLAQAALRLDRARASSGWWQDEELAFATRVRCCDPRGLRAKHHGAPAGCPTGSSPWDAHYAGPAFIVHGHWAMRGFDRGAHTMNLDSGCVYGGALTAWCLEEDRIVWVPSRG